MTSSTGEDPILNHVIDGMEASYIGVPTIPNPDRKWWQIWKPRFIETSYTELPRTVIVVNEPTNKQEE